MPLFTILSLFPEAIDAYLRVGVVGQALARGLLAARVVDFRDFTRDRHRTVDDRPFGGGPGMVLKPEPIVEAVEWIEQELGPHRRIALCPSGRPLDQTVVRELHDYMSPGGTTGGPLAPDSPQAPSMQTDDRRLLLLCGRYEGFDERIYDELQLERISVGDYVLAGGELPALCVLESVARLLPGVLGDERSAREDSFDAEEGSLGPLDHPHYTRPRVFRGRDVPEVLFSGDHARIAAWRAARAAERTALRRPDLGEDAEQETNTPPARPGTGTPDP